MKIKITRDTVCDGDFVKKGKTIDTSEGSAKFLIRIGKAIVAPETEEEIVAPETRVTNPPKRKLGRPKK